MSKSEAAVMDFNTSVEPVAALIDKVKKVDRRSERSAPKHLGKGATKKAAKAVAKKPTKPQKASKAKAKVKAAPKAEKPQKRSYGLEDAKVAELLKAAKTSKSFPNPFRATSSYATCVNAILACGKLGAFYPIKTILQHYAKVADKDAFAAFKARSPRNENGLEKWQEKAEQNCTVICRANDYGLPLLNVGFVAKRQRLDGGTVQFGIFKAH